MHTGYTRSYWHPGSRDELCWQLLQNPEFFPIPPQKNFPQCFPEFFLNFSKFSLNFPKISPKSTLNLPNLFWIFSELFQNFLDFFWIFPNSAPNFPIFPYFFLIFAGGWWHKAVWGLWVRLACCSVPTNRIGEWRQMKDGHHCAWNTNSLSLIIGTPDLHSKLRLQRTLFCNHCMQLHHWIMNCTIL